MTHVASIARPSQMMEMDSARSRYLLLGLGISLTIHAMGILGLSLVGNSLDTIRPPSSPPTWVNPSIPNWFPAPAIPTAPSHSAARIGKVGIPVPVPEVPIETTMPNQGEMNPGVGIVGEEGGEVTVGAGELGSPGEPADPRPDEGFIPVEKDPVLIRSAVPKYPEIALRAGLEGRVWLKIWVDREGRPREVHLVKSDNDIFNDAAIEAAKQFLFTPAVMNNGPVSVWVTLPFGFKLKER